DVVGQATVDVAGELDEACLEAALPRLPGKVVRVDRNAVAAQTRAGIERHEAERLCLCRVDDLPDIDLHPVAHQGKLVHEADVDGAERDLEQLDHFRDASAGPGHDGVDHLTVERDGDLGARFVVA